MSHVETFTDSTGTNKQLEFRFHRDSRMRYMVQDLDTLIAEDNKLLTEYITHHQTYQRPRLQELLDYARGMNHTISKVGRRREEDMADARAIHNFGKHIASFRKGYMAGKPIQVEYDKDATVQEVLRDLAIKSNFDSLNRQLIGDLVEVGRAYDLTYRNSDDKTRTVRLDPLGTFVIYQQNVELDSVAAVRYYQATQFNPGKYIVEVYTTNNITTYTFDGKLTLEREEPHSFDAVPVTEYLNIFDGMGALESELNLIDLLDGVQSDTANYMQDLSDAMLAIFGRVEFPDDVTTTDGQIEYLKKMRKARLLQLVPPMDAEGKEGKVDAKYLYKQYDVSGTEAYKTRLVNDIHKFTNTPDLSDEKFSGNASGEALKWKIFGLEQEAVDMRALFEKSLRRRYKLALKMAKVVQDVADFDVAALKFTFTPNLPADAAGTLEIVKGLYGIVSDETLVKLLENLTGVDAEQEMKRLAEGVDEPAPRVGDTDGQK